MTSALSCRSCQSSEVSVFCRLRGVPVHCNVLLESREEAVGYSRGDITLAFCEACGLIYNAEFDPGLIEYKIRYENSLISSPRFRSYVDDLATRLAARYDLRGKQVIEIGCGDAAFLSLVCEKGGGTGVGFEPSFGYEPGNGKHSRVEIISDYYDERYSDLSVDLVCCRQTLEHIEFPGELLTVVRGALGHQDDPAAFFEVPNVDFILQRDSVWDVIYEHCSYFSAGSLARLFERHGFTPSDVWEDFDGQYLCIETGVSNGKAAVRRVPEDDVDSLARGVARFAESFDATLQVWRRELETLSTSGAKTVVWGAGSKGVMFSNLLQAQEAIEYFVDINPKKQGKYLPGTGQKIVAPSFLTDYEPDAVILMNAVYRREVEASLEEIGVRPEILVI